MHFNTVAFVLFFIAFAITFYAVKKEYQRHLLLSGSLIFFASFNLLSIISVIYISIIAYICIQLLSTIPYGNTIKKGILIGFCIIMVIPLLLAKLMISDSSFINTEVIQDDYYNMYLHPVGISFYTLQALGLVIDTYKKQLSKIPSFFNVLSFTSFFPQALAGPIHRGNDLMPQIYHSSGFYALNLLTGVRILVWGFICKLLVADKLALLISPVFSDIGAYSRTAIMIATFLFSIQIYFDFYGYTEIARGLAKILGIDLALNFKFPYLASSFTEFWHRWHISLSSWFRDYVYIPLGGSREGYWKYVFAVIITFFLSGIWHGSSVNFILWGLLHAFFILAEERLAKLKQLNRLKSFKIIRFFKILTFYFLLCFTWLIFKITNTSTLLSTLKRMVSSQDGLIGISKFLSFNTSVFILLTGLVIIMNGYGRFKRLLSSEMDNTNDYLYNSLYLSTSLILLVIFGDLGMQQFLYFNF